MLKTSLAALSSDSDAVRMELFNQMIFKFHSKAAQFYSSSNSKYTGKTSDNQSLSRHQLVYYAQCNIAQLTASQGMECLINMIDTQSLAGTFYLNEMFGQVQTLEDAFDKLFAWSRQSTTYNLFIRE